MDNIKSIYLHHFKNKGFLVSLFFAVLIFVSALFINYYAGSYAIGKASNSVSDIVLDNIRVYDVDAIFIYGPIIFWIFVGLVLLKRPWKIPFVLKSIGLFILVRSLFITLTHTAPPADHILITLSRIKIFTGITAGGDLFFSGHTGLPFLMALIFWNDKWLRTIFIICSLILGAVVLMAHVHYTIDVLSAFFITYTIYHMAEVIFKRDKKIFDSGIKKGREEPALI